MVHFLLDQGDLDTSDCEGPRHFVAASLRSSELPPIPPPSLSPKAFLLGFVSYLHAAVISLSTFQSAHAPSGSTRDTRLLSSSRPDSLPLPPQPSRRTSGQRFEKAPRLNRGRGCGSATLIACQLTNNRPHSPTSSTSTSGSMRVLAVVQP